MRRMEAARPSQQRVMMAGSEALSQRKVGGVPESGEADEREGVEVVGGGEDALGTDEAADLQDESEKSGEEDQAEGAEEEPAGYEVGWEALGAGEEIQEGALDGVHGRPLQMRELDAGWARKAEAECSREPDGAGADELLRGSSTRAARLFMMTCSLI